MNFSRAYLLHLLTNERIQTYKRTLNIYVISSADCILYIYLVMEFPGFNETWSYDTL
jgi:hypothetical protein